MDYKTFGLGSNDGDSSLIFSIENSHLKIKSFSISNLSEIKNTSDTLGKQYYIQEDSIIIHENLNIQIQESTIDSIEMYLKLPHRDRINTNFCVKSGSVHIIRIKSDSVNEQSFRLYNTFDTTALEITDLIFNYLPKNSIDFRPLEMWELDKKCEDGMKLRKTERKSEDIPENRMNIIEQTTRDSLEIKNE